MESSIVDAGCPVKAIETDLRSVQNLLAFQEAVLSLSE
jgi:hypothetical protein